MGHDRLHALDAVRGFALIAGIFLHSAMSFLPGFAQTGIPIADRSPSLTLAVAFYVIHMFRMTVFFVIAGFFGRMLLERDGLWKFSLNRGVRILLPLVVFWWITFPAIVITAQWALDPLSGEVLKPPPLRDGNRLLLFPLIHLWFLYVLLLFYVGVVLLRGLGNRVLDRSHRFRSGLDRWLRDVLSRDVAILALALPTCVSLGLSAEWIPWFGIPTPDQSLIPDESSVIAYSTAFGLGWMLERQKELIQCWQQRWTRSLVLAMATTVAALCLIGAVPSYTTIGNSSQKWAYALCYTVGIWSWTFAVFGIALHCCANPSPIRRYLADASYWMYLTHMPLVFFLQVALEDLPWHWTVKFPTVFVVTMLVLLASYHGLVRSTCLGEWLNGRRVPRSRVKPVAAPCAST